MKEFRPKYLREEMSPDGLVLVDAKTGRTLEFTPKGAAEAQMRAYRALRASDRAKTGREVMAALARQARALYGEKAPPGLVPGRIVVRPGIDEDEFEALAGVWARNTIREIAEQWQDAPTGGKAMPESAERAFQDAVENTARRPKGCVLDFGGSLNAVAARCSCGLQCLYTLREDANGGQVWLKALNPLHWCALPAGKRR